MAEIINLRQARKTRKRQESESRAQANRLKHGSTKAEKRIAEMDRQRQDAAIEGARRDPAED
jgi:DNA replication protein DnaC